MPKKLISISELKTSPAILDGTGGALVLRNSQPYAFYVPYEEFVAMVEELEKLRDLEALAEVLDAGQDRKPKEPKDLL